MSSSARHDRGFWSVALAFGVVMAFSTVPSPLYGLYQARDGFSSLTVTFIFSAYAVGVVAALLLAGHLSDWHGRRRVLLPAIATSLASAAVFLLWRDVPGLILARVVNGLSVGVVTATATAYLSELHATARPGGSPVRSQLVATGVNLGGLGLGPVVSGALAQWAPDPLTLPYLVFVVLLLVAVAVVATTPETRPKLDPLPGYRPQRVAVPAEVRAPFIAAAVSAVVSFGVMGLFTGLSATLLVGTFGQHSHLLIGVAVLVVFGSGVVAQLLTAAAAPARVNALGVALMVGGLALFTLSAWLPTPSLAVFLAGGAIAGAGAGALFKGAVGTVVAITPPAERAEALAALFLAGYVGLSFPVVGAGIALQSASPQDTLLGFAIVAGTAILATAPRLVRPRPAGVPAPAAA